MKAIYFISILAVMGGCTSQRKAVAPPQPGIPIQGKLFASAYQQLAAEYHALCLQAYNLARIRVDESLQQASDKPRAIVTDLDETALDNSRFLMCTRHCREKIMKQKLVGMDFNGTGRYCSRGLFIFKICLNQRHRHFLYYKSR